MTQVREPALVSTFDQDKLWTLCSDYDRFKRDGGRAPNDRFLIPQVAKALRGMIGNLDPTRANAPLEEIVRDYVHVARNGILPPATGQGSNASDNMRRMEWEFLRNDLLAVKPNSKIRHSNFLADVSTFAFPLEDCPHQLFSVLKSRCPARLHMSLAWFFRPHPLHSNTPLLFMSVAASPAPGLLGAPRCCWTLSVCLLQQEVLNDRLAVVDLSASQVEV
jgi:hypothetical protein